MVHNNHNQTKMHNLETLTGLTKDSTLRVNKIIYKSREGKTQIFFSQGRYSWPDILGRQKISQVAAYVPKSKNVESSLNFKNVFSIRVGHSLMEAKFSSLFFTLCISHAVRYL